ARVRALPGQGTVGRAHLARALVEAGHVASIGQAFRQLLAEGRPAYVPQARPTGPEGIVLIARPGRAPAVPHPRPAQEAPPPPTPGWTAQGLAGLKGLHPAHDPQQEAHYPRLAQEWDLLPTGGSDAHGRERPEDQPGAVRVPLAWVEGLRRVATRPSRRPRHPPTANTLCQQGSVTPSGRPQGRQPPVGERFGLSPGRRRQHTT